MIEEVGSDTRLYSQEPSALKRITHALNEEREKWDKEQSLVNQQPVMDDPGEDYPDREPILDD